MLIITQLKTGESIWSITALYKGANWLEREIWDMYGVFFDKHQDLRRILTDYNFKWYPLKKEYPLTGYCELLYHDEKKKILYFPLEFTQEFRKFDYKISWFCKLVN